MHYATGINRVSDEQAEGIEAERERTMGARSACTRSIEGNEMAALGAQESVRDAARIDLIAEHPSGSADSLGECALPAGSARAGCFEGRDRLTAHPSTSEKQKSCAFPKLIAVLTIVLLL